jgi:hypothetical protein
MVDGLLLHMLHAVRSNSGFSECVRSLELELLVFFSVPAGLTS